MTVAPMGRAIRPIQPVLVDSRLRQWGPAVFASFLEGLVCHAIGTSDENGIRGRRRRESGLLGVGSLNIGVRLCRRACDNDDYYDNEEEEECAGGEETRGSPHLDVP